MTGDVGFSAAGLIAPRSLAAANLSSEEETVNATTLPAPGPSTEEAAPFIDRRNPAPTGNAPVRERRQFTNSHAELSDDAAQLARAIDEYKARHRRRFINYEEVLGVVKSLGYSK